MKKTTILTIIIFRSLMTYGQTASLRQNNVFFELGGSGGIGSINVEKFISSRNRLRLNWRMGLSLAPIDKNNGTGIVFPIMVNALIGKNAHCLEMGVGQGLTITTKGSLFALTTVAVGYRHQSKSEKWFYRVTYTPLISYLVDLQIQQWGGLSIGYTLTGNSR